MFFFSNNWLFLFFLIIFCFSCFNSLSWSGSIFFVDSYVYVILVFMSVFVYCLVLFSEKNFSLVGFSQLLVVISVFFFFSSNFLLFYIFFELSIFPILIMILGYGYQIEKINASYYLVFYACVCSLPFLFVYFNSDFLISLVYFDFVFSWELVLVLSLSFMMKFPLFFFHLWLPKAHVEAPTTASMLLAGLLLKFGTVGFVRIMKCVNYCHLNYFFFIAFLGMILSSFSCVFQSDCKSLAAYSSICHMSFLFLSLIFFGSFGKTSGLLMMVSHGYTSALMFYFIGVIYNSLNTRMIYYFGNLMNFSIFFSILFSLVFISNSCVPPSLGFFSEFLSLSGSYILYSGLFFCVFVYFIVAFYYSIYIIVVSLMGKDFFDYYFYSIYFSFPFVFMCFNVFWLMVVF